MLNRHHLRKAAVAVMNPAVLIRSMKAKGGIAGSANEKSSEEDQREEIGPDRL